MLAIIVVMEDKPVKIDPVTGRLIATRDISKDETITLTREEYEAMGPRESIHPPIVTITNIRLHGCAYSIDLHGTYTGLE